MHGADDGIMASAIREWRKAAGVSQTALADMLRITASSANDLEHGRRNLTDHRIIACTNEDLRHALIVARSKEFRARVDAMYAAIQPATPAEPPTWPAMPPNYVKLPAGVRCRCIKLRLDEAGDHWCCTPRRAGISPNSDPQS